MTSSPTPPPAPDPAATAAAQGAANLETAIGQGWLNALNQYGPFGSITYSQIGEHQVGDQMVPQFAQTTTLSPQQQAQYDLINALQMQALGLGQNVLGNVESAVNQPFPTADSFTADRDAVVQGLIERNQPQMDRQRSMMETQLANQGIMPGSEAFKNRMDDLARQENDFRLAALNAGGAEQNRLFGLSQAARSQPINEYATLLGLGGQINTPQAAYMPPQLANTDVMGPINMQYQGQLAGWNANNAAQQNMYGNLFGLGGTLGAGAWLMSDPILKTDIHLRGYEKGLPIYHFRYNGDPEKTVYRGVMATDVYKVCPDAVHLVDGYLAVDYNMLGIECAKVH